MSHHFLHRGRQTMREAMLSDSHDNCQAAVKTWAKHGFFLAEGRLLLEALEAKVRPS